MIGCDQSTYDKAMEMILMSFGELTLRERRIVEMAARTAYKHALAEAIKDLTDRRHAAG